MTVKNILDLPGRVQPQAIDVEAALLCCFLLDEKTVAAAVTKINETFFYNESHRQIFIAIASLFHSQLSIDQITVAEELRRMNQLERVGGRMVLMDIVNKLPTASNVEEYLDIVAEKKHLRDMITIGCDMTSAAYAGELDSKEIKANAFSALLKAETVKQITFSEQATEHFDRLNNPDVVDCIPTGWPKLDNVLLGWGKSWLIIVAARPGVGKSILAQQTAMHMAIEQRKRVAYFNYEMSIVPDMMNRVYAQRLSIDLDKFVKKQLSPREMKRISDYYLQLTGIDNLFFYDTTKMTALEIRAECLAKNVDVCIVDFMQLMPFDRKRMNKNEGVGANSRDLKLLAKEMNIPVIALSQLNRDVEKENHSGKPRWANMGDLRDSGELEQNTDVALFLNPETYEEEPLMITSNISAALGKHRHFNAGNFTTLIKEKSFVRFTEKEEFEKRKTPQERIF